MKARFIWETPEEINLVVAKNIRKLRKRRKVSQKELSRVSGVSYGSVKRFEETGNISLVSLTKIAIALSVEHEIKELFANVPYKSIEEIENE